MDESLSRRGWTRRSFQRALPAFALSLGLGRSGLALAADKAADKAADAATTTLAYIGMQGSQIRALRLDTAAGTLSLIGPVADTPKPTWVLAHPQLPVLYAVNDDSAKEGTVTAFTVNRESGALARINEVAAGGAGTTFLSVDAASATLLAANFGGGSASSIALNRDGSLGARVSTLAATGSGPHRRQASAHGHGVLVDPSGRYALVADMGADRVFVYGFDAASHALLPDAAGNPRAFVAPPGSGPRHLAFGLSGRFVYLLMELTAEIATLRWEAGAGQGAQAGQGGRLTLVQSLPTSSADFQGAKSGSELAVSRDGRFVYVGNRGEHAIVVYRVHPETGELAFVQRLPSGGEVPWGFAIHPSGAWMLVANQRSGRVNLLRIDTATGLLTDTGQAVDVPAPVSVAFVSS